jgi:hypothetical protein
MHQLIEFSKEPYEAGSICSHPTDEKTANGLLNKPAQRYLLIYSNPGKFSFGLLLTMRSTIS